MTIFSTNNVSKTYANHKALDKVSINVEKGSVFGLLGPNGAGKTTLIRIINQITAPDEGEIYFMGEKLRSEHVHKIGYLPEERGLYKKMKVGKYSSFDVGSRNFMISLSRLQRKAPVQASHPHQTNTRFSALRRASPSQR